MTQEILAVARAHLATHGAAGLSLRAVARDLGMASSAVYRYVPSRDDLLTRLIVQAYDALGAAAEEAEEGVPRQDFAGRFRAVAIAVRRWALAHEHEYALIFGSPVPGYRAPDATVAPATRVPRLLVGILLDRLAAGDTANHLQEPAADVVWAMEPVRAVFEAQGRRVPAASMARGLMAWTYLFGAVSFDLFGHRHNVVAHERAVESAFFAFEVDAMVRWLELDRGSDPHSWAG
jgi:AcrR family transcriptional regulator